MKYEIFDVNPSNKAEISETKKISAFSIFPRREVVSFSPIFPPDKYGKLNFSISPSILGEAVELAKAIPSKASMLKKRAAPTAKIFIATPDTI